MSPLQNGRAPLAADPAFVPSLRLLVERERYSLTDIGMMFGVTRERIRQLCERYKIAHSDSAGRRGLGSVRVWVDGLNRFMPVPKCEVLQAQRQRAVSRRASARARILVERRSRIAEQVRALAASLGRDPTVLEIATTIRPDKNITKANAAMYVLSAWGSGSGSTSERYRRGMGELRTAAGIGARARGGRGHTTPRTLRTHCKRGHDLSLTRNKWRSCETCSRNRAREDYQRKRATVAKVCAKGHTVAVLAREWKRLADQCPVCRAIAGDAA